MNLVLNSSREISIVNFKLRKGQASDLKESFFNILKHYSDTYGKRRDEVKLIQNYF
jgi:hypothetical protein